MCVRPSFAIVVLAALPVMAASIPESKPEGVGLSAERLLRIHETVQRHMDSHQIAGASKPGHTLAD